MSLLGLITLAIITINIIKFNKWKRIRFRNILLILLFVELFMAIGANFLQVILILIFPLSIKIFKRYFEKKSMMFIIMSFIILTTVYVEYFNGIETFKDKSEFFSYHMKGKEHYWLLPQKTFEVRPGHPNNIEIKAFTPESRISAGSHAGLFVTKIKISENELYYLAVKRRFGEHSETDWVKFGKETCFC